MLHLLFPRGKSRWRWKLGVFFNPDMNPRLSIHSVFVFVLLQGVTDEKFDVQLRVEDAAIIVTSEKEPKAACTITLTSPIMRDDGPAAGGSEGLVGARSVWTCALFARRSQPASSRHGAPPVVW